MVLFTLVASGQPRFGGGERGLEKVACLQVLQLGFCASWWIVASLNYRNGSTLSARGRTARCAVMQSVRLVYEDRKALG